MRISTSMVETLNAWSPGWFEAMIRGLVEGFVLLGIVLIILMIGRRRLSNHLAQGLFLLVTLKVAASAVSPWVLSLPIPFSIERSSSPTVPLSPTVLTEPAIATVSPAALVPRVDPSIMAAPPRASDPVPLNRPAEDRERGASVIEAPAVWPSWTTWLMLGWGLVVTALLARFLAGHFRFSRRLRDEPAMDPSLLPADPSQIARNAGLKRPVELLQTNLVSSPAVWGLLRPRVLLPRTMSDGLTHDQFTWVLLHEFAHIARGDLWFLLGQRLVQLVFFFNPAVLVANRLADIYREFACDETALARGNLSRHACGEGFLTIVERACRPREAAAPMTIGLFNSYTLFRARLARLLDDTRRPSARLSRPAIAALCAFALLATSRVDLHAQAQPQPKPHEHQKPASVETKPVAESKPANRTVEVTVVEARTGKPMVGVKVESVLVVNQKLETMFGKTDASGRARVTIPKGDYANLELKVSKDNFVPLSQTWKLTGPTAELLPEMVTFRLDPGTKISGSVRNEEGQPVEGTRVFVIVPVNRRQYDGPAPLIWDFSTTTDKDGRWECGIIPAKAPVICVSEIIHADYAHGHGQYLNSPEQIMLLRSGDYTDVLKRGLPVRGVVRDRKGRPIAGATVADGRERANRNNLETKTNEQGEFQLPHVAPGALVLVAQVDGFAPDLQEMTVKANMEPVAFTLGPPHSIRGRVIDAAGKPIPSVGITVDEWRGYRSLAIKLTTDEQGRFRIDNLPDSPVKYQFYKEGYANLPDQQFAPSNQEHVVTLPRLLIITGKVTDSSTGEPVKEFMLLEGDDPGRGNLRWNRERARRFRDGRYALSYGWPYPSVRGLRIEAEGFLPANSRGFQNDEGTVAHDFKLVRGKEPTRPAISGVVLLPDGKPAENADVTLVTKSDGIYIQNGRPLDPSKLPSYRTNTDGKFAFDPLQEEVIVMAFHDQGIGEISEADLQKNSDHAITLQKWGRVEGTLRVGTKPVEEEEIALDPYSARNSTDRSIRPSYHYQTKSDRLGRYSFDRVVPGAGRAMHGIWTSPHTMTFGASTRYEVKPGETIQVRIGGTGRPLIGRFVKPDDTKIMVDWTQTHQRLMLKAPPTKPLKGATKEERIKEYDEWLKTPDGKVYDEYQKNNRSYGFRVDEDGSFRIDDVTAGTYELFLTVMDTPQNGRRTLAEVVKTVVVPKMETGQSVEPLDVGNLILGPPQEP